MIKTNKKLPLHKFIATGGKPKGFVGTKGTMPSKGNSPKKK